MSEATKAAMRARLIRKGLIKEPIPVKKPKKEAPVAAEEPAGELQGEAGPAVQVEGEGTPPDSFSVPEGEEVVAEIE